jgi:hypothetical protein
VNFSGWGLLAGVVFGSIGVGYFMYARRAMRITYLVAGMLLMIFPWFVDNLAALIGVGLALVLAPFAIAWWFDV